MKTYLFAILLSFSAMINAQDLFENLSDEKVKFLTCEICLDLFQAQDSALEIPRWSKTFSLEFDFITESTPPQEFFNEFLNIYGQQLVCPPLLNSSVPQQHFFKRILAVGLNETYEEYFFNLENGDVNFNAFEIIDGKKETLLDWIEVWIASGRGDTDELRDVGSVLRDEFGAKYGHELND